MGNRREADKVSFDGRIIKEIREEMNLKQDELANIFGIKRTSLWKFEREDAEIPVKYMDIIREFVHTRGSSVRSQFKKIDTGKYLVSVPLVTSNKYNDFIHSFSVETPSMSFVSDKEDSNYYIAFEISDVNMDNGSAEGLKKGDVALSKRVRKDQFDKEFEPGKYYVLVVSEDILVTSILSFDDTSKDIVCHSLNTSPVYKDFHLNLESDVRDVYKVVQRVTTV